MLAGMTIFYVTTFYPAFAHTIKDQNEVTGMFTVKNNWTNKCVETQSFLLHTHMWKNI